MRAGGACHIVSASFRRVAKCIRGGHVLNGDARVKETETYHDGRIKCSRSVDTRRWMQEAAGNSVNGKKSKDTICTEKERLKECGKERKEEREKREERKKK